MNQQTLCKLSDDQNVYGASDGSIVVYSAGAQHRYRFSDGIWTDATGHDLSSVDD